MAQRRMNSFTPRYLKLDRWASHPLTVGDCPCAHALLWTMFLAALRVLDEPPWRAHGFVRHDVLKGA